MGLRRLHGRVRQEHVGDLDANTDADSNNIDPDPDADPHANDQFGRLLCGGLGVEPGVRFGDVVSCGGNNWTANQWNYDEVRVAHPAPGTTTVPAET